MVKLLLCLVTAALWAMFFGLVGVLFFGPAVPRWLAGWYAIGAFGSLILALAATADLEEYERRHPGCPKCPHEEDD